jgi:hypothetical protein
MDDIARAKKTGYRLMFKAITAGLIVAYTMMAFFSWDLLWLFGFEYALLMVMAIVVTYAAGFFFGRIAGVAIIIKQKNKILIGVLYTFLVVWTTLLLCSLPGFFGERWETTTSIGDRIIDYIVKPLWWVTLFGSLPTLIIGLWLGKAIKSHSEKRD